MCRDEIIEEVWKSRETYAASHGHNLAKIVGDLMARQKKSRRVVMDRRPVLDDDADTDKVATRFRPTDVASEKDRMLGDATAAGKLRRPRTL